jgi:glutamate synthase (NADPH/NADH)
MVLSDEQLKSAAENSLWRPQLEKDACGVGFCASVKGIQTHEILQSARVMLERMAHRGACVGDNDSGDGAGVMTAIPDKLYREDIKMTNNIELPPPGLYATGILFLTPESYKQAKESFSDLARGCKLQVLAWRKLKVNSEHLGKESRKTEPLMRQVFVTSDFAADQKRFHQAVYLLRKQTTVRMSHQGVSCYVVSLSAKTIAPSSYNPTTGLVAVVVQSQASFNLLEVNCIATVTCPRPQGSSASSSRTGEASCWVLRGEKGRIGPLSRLCLRTGI